MKQTLLYYFKNTLIFQVGALLFIGLGLYVYFSLGQIPAHLALNRYHHPITDQFYKYYTYIGGGFPCYLGIALLFWKMRTGLYLLLSQGVASLLTQPLKHLLAHPRPSTLFNQLGLQLPDTVEGVHLWDACNSFPSGHTSAIFALFGCLAILTASKGKAWQVLLLILAVLGAYSRIYLSQHFLEDTLCGAPLGIVAAALVYMCCYYRPWGNESVQQFVKKHRHHAA